MNIGMLWFDNDPRTEVKIKIEKAADYYQKKYGSLPNLCYVHPSMLEKQVAAESANAQRNGAIEVRSSNSILPNHFWIGINGSIRLSGS